MSYRILALLACLFALGLVSAAEPPAMTPLRKDVKPFEYADAKVPFYPPSTVWGVTGAPISRMQKPLPASESLKHFVHPIDFDLKLFADETLLGGGKPLCMNWDERGRLFVVVSVDYPNELQPEGQGRDSIVILEDANGDGVADKRTVFADKLSIPTSLTFSRGGVIAFQYPHTLFLKDTDGDGRADERKVLFTGWGFGDTHAGPSNLKWGMDNWVYGIVGYSGFNGTVGGTQHRFMQGFYRFNPDGSALEFLRNTNNNSWGVGFSEEGLLFGSTANGNPSVFLPIPNRYYERVRGWSSSVLPGIAGNAPMYPVTEKVRQVDWHDHFTAGAGHALYTARTYPKEYWNRSAFVCEPTGHLAATFTLHPQGSDFTARNSWNLLASDDEWAAPTVAEVGPDGNVWLIDWYAFIVQHNPTPRGYQTGKGNAYETDLRDKKHSRIYRLVPKATPLGEKFTLTGATPEQLVATLKHSNMFWRQHAQRLLVERGSPDVAPLLVGLIRDSSVDAIGLNPGAIHALWTLHGLGLAGREEMRAAVEGALKHPSAGVRRNAVAVLAAGAAPTAAAIAPLTADPDAQVRLAAFLALADLPASAGSGPILASALAKTENSDDRWIPDAITSAGSVNATSFLESIARLRTPLATRALQVVGIVAEHVARGGGSDGLTTVLVPLADAPPKTAEAVIAGLAKGWPRDAGIMLPAAADSALQRLFPRLPPLAKGQLVKLATAWGSQSFAAQAATIAETLLATVRDDKAPEGDRIGAAQQLVGFRPDDDKAIDALLDSITARLAPPVASGVIDAVGLSTAPGAGSAVLKRYDAWPPSTRQVALRVLVSRPESARALVDALEKGTVAVTDLSLTDKQALTSLPDRRISDAARRVLARGGGLPDADRQKVIDEMTALVEKSGSLANGKEMFKKHCGNCHRHSGEGNHVGPDLTGMAAHPKSELLVHVFDPSRSVEGNYRQYDLTTTDGRRLQGVLSSESKTAVELVDSQAKTHAIQRSEIEALTMSAKSVMPEGFEKQMTKEEIVDLFTFLTAKGKYLSLPLDRAATAVSTRGLFTNEATTDERLVFPDWGPKTVGGVPFVLGDPRGDRLPNVILLHGPGGAVSSKMPRSVSLPVNTPAKAIHLLSGVSSGGHPGGTKGSLTMTVRLHYAGGLVEDHKLLNGVHFADVMRAADVPESKAAFDLGGRQVRYLAVTPKRADLIERVEFVKGDDATAPIVVAATVETRE